MEKNTNKTEEQKGFDMSLFPKECKPLSEEYMNNCNNTMDFHQADANQKRLYESFDTKNKKEEK